MCAIVDNNMRDRFFSRPVDPELQPLWKWIDDRKGMLVVGGHLRAELYGSVTARRAIQEWVRTRRAKDMEETRPGDVEAETLALEEAGVCTSDDEHVIALAIVSGARLLCSEDQQLHADFKSLLSGPKGSIYQHAGHMGLFRPDRRWHRSCPLRSWSAPVARVCSVSALRLAAAMPGA